MLAIDTEKNAIITEAEKRKLKKIYYNKVGKGYSFMIVANKNLYAIDAFKFGRYIVSVTTCTDCMRPRILTETGSFEEAKDVLFETIKEDEK